MLKALKVSGLKPEYHKLLSDFAINVNLRRSIKDVAVDASGKIVAVGSFFYDGVGAYTRTLLSST